MKCDWCASPVNPLKASRMVGFSQTFCCPDCAYAWQLALARPPAPAPPSPKCDQCKRALPPTNYQIQGHVEFFCSIGCANNWTISQSRVQAPPLAPEPKPEPEDWRAWARVREGECACGIPRASCEYHR